MYYLNISFSYKISEKILSFCRIIFPACMQENQIFFQNNCTKLKINLRPFLSLKNKRLS